MTTTQPPLKTCAPGEDAEKQRNKKGIWGECLQQMQHLCRDQGPLNTPSSDAPLETPKKTNATIVAKTQRELLPTQTLASSLRFYSPKANGLTPEPANVKAPACPPSPRSSLRDKKLALAQKLSKGDITPEEYERKMCLLWDRPKLDAEGDWVMVDSKGPSGGSTSGSHSGNDKPDAGRCVLM